jgi:hypothetical protein
MYVARHGCHSRLLPVSSFSVGAEEGHQGLEQLVSPFVSSDRAVMGMYAVLHAAIYPIVQIESLIIHSVLSWVPCASYPFPYSASCQGELWAC